MTGLIIILDYSFYHRKKLLIYYKNSKDLEYLVQTIGLTKSVDWKKNYVDDDKHKLIETTKWWTEETNYGQIVNLSVFFPSNLFGRIKIITNDIIIN